MMAGFDGTAEDLAVMCRGTALQLAIEAYKDDTEYRRPNPGSQAGNHDVRADKILAAASKFERFLRGGPAAETDTP